MVAGFFRLKDRKTRRVGLRRRFAAGPSMETYQGNQPHLLITWAKFLKEMEEVWLQTRKKSETEERWMEQIQKIQADIWQALAHRRDCKISTATPRGACRTSAGALLDPLEDLSSRVFPYSQRSRSFPKTMGTFARTNSRVAAARKRSGAPRARRNSQHSGQHPTGRPHPRVARRLCAAAGFLPSKAQLSFVKFDAINNRVVYSRQELQRIWSHTLSNLRQLKLWQIQPWKLTKRLSKTFLLTTSFAISFREFSKH